MTSKTESPDSIEQYYAHMESDRNESEAAYFDARPFIDREGTPVDTFRAGFERAYQLLWDDLQSSRRETARACQETCEAIARETAALRRAHELEKQLGIGVHSQFDEGVRYEKELAQLRGKLAAAEQHIKILQEQRSSGETGAVKSLARRWLVLTKDGKPRDTYGCCSYAEDALREFDEDTPEEAPHWYVEVECYPTGADLPEKTNDYTNRDEVMNPPASAAQGAEAGNLNMSQCHGTGAVPRAAEARPAEAAPPPESRIGDPCPVCASGRIGQQGYYIRCANCGWLGPRVSWAPK